MKVGSHLATATQAYPELAAEAIAGALDAAGLKRADSVILFLTRDYTRHAPAALRAAARVAGTLSIGGCTAYGIMTERGSHLEHPGAAALVIGGAAGSTTNDGTLLSFSGQRLLPFDWQQGPARVGLLDAEAATWAHGRLNGDDRAEFSLDGFRAHLAYSGGLSALSNPLQVDAATGYDLQRLDGCRPAESLHQYLPDELRQAPPLHRLALLRNRDLPALPILGTNADGALTLGEPLTVGERVQWAIRQPERSVADMDQALAEAMPATTAAAPAFALMLSCLGRGPLFYGGEDLDLAAFRERFPGTPLVGAYGSGQIRPASDGNRLFQNSVLTLLFETTDV